MRGGLVVAVACALLIAGCLDGETRAVPSAAASSAPPATVTETTGGIEGSVRTDERLPLTGVQVALRQAGTPLSTDADGRFSFSRLEPRNYTLDYARQGYGQGVVDPVPVKAGQVTFVNITLKALPVAKVYNRTQVFDGYVRYGQAFLDFYTGQLDNDICDCRWEFNSSKNLRSVVLELRFTPSVPNPAVEDAMWYELWTQAGWEDPSADCLRCGYWEDGDRVIVDGNWTNGETFNLAGACDVVWPCYEQEFRIHATLFYHDAAPRNFTALA